MLTLTAPAVRQENADNINVVVVLPTYNERENIGPLLEAILSHRERLGGVNLSVLVVDDLSPDGTGDVVRAYSAGSAHVHLLSGDKKRGLGTAYKRGLLHAMRDLKADIVFQMDADFSHDPQDIPRLLAEARGGSDFVIGSRYVVGGSIPSDWSLLRKAISRWGNIFARRVAGLRGVRDCTSGYRAIRVGALERVELDTLADTGYIFIMSLLYEAVQSGASVAEIPIRYTERRYGQSKLGLADISEFIVKVFSLRLKSLRSRQPKLPRLRADTDAL